MHCALMDIAIRGAKLCHCVSSNALLVLLLVSVP